MTKYTTDELLYALKVLHENDSSIVTPMIQNPSGEEAQRLTEMFDMVSDGLETLIARISRFSDKPEEVLALGVSMVSTASLLTALGDDREAVDNLTDWMASMATVNPSNAVWVPKLIMIAFGLGFAMGGRK